MTGHRTRLPYRPEIDGLRAIAVIVVLLHHIWPGIVTGGYIGVDVFFVISGYLITGIVTAQMHEGAFSFASFYERRARRLLPALLVMLAVVLVAGWFVFLPSDYLATFRAALATTLFASNLEFWKVLAQGYFAPDSKLNPLLHTWSLGVEEQFYLFFPPLLLALTRWAPKRIGQIVVASIAASFGACLLMLGPHSVAVFFLAPFRAWELLVGAALAVGVAPSIRSARMGNLAALCGLAGILVSVFLLTPATPFPGWAALLPVLGSAAIIHATGASRRDAVTAILSSPSIVYLGRISYSLYLWHWPLVVFVKYALQAEIGPWIGCLLIGSSVGLAALSYRFVENVFRHRSGSSNSRSFVVKALAWSALVACISLVGIASAGFASRMPPRALVFDKARRASIPFRQCDRKQPWCVLGDSRSPPDILFWGDSHMLAWAPAIDHALRARGKSGYVAIHSACPPVPGIQMRSIPDCVSFNGEVHAFLSNSPTVRRIVLAANWNAYVLPGRVRSGDPAGSGRASDGDLAWSLQGLIRDLRRLHKTVVLVGPVPTYSRDVPFELARGAAGFGLGRRPARNPDFASPALRRVAEECAVEYLDVEQLMCSNGACELNMGSRSLYRDDQHLSVAGAMRYEGLMGRAIDSAQASQGSR